MNALFVPEFQIYWVLGIAFFLAISFLSPTVGLTLMAFAMLFSPEFSIGSIGTREMTLRTEDILIPLLLMAWISRLAIRREFQLIVASPLNFPILLLIGLSILSTARGIAVGSVPSPLTAVFYILKTVEFFTVFFLVLTAVRTEPAIRRFLAFTILVFVCVGVYALFQVPSVEIFSTNRITAPFEGNPEPATIGGYMAFLLLIITSLFLYEKNPARKWLYGLIGIIVFIPFLYTLNRTSYAAFLAGLFFIALIEKRRRFVLFVIALLLITPVFFSGAVKERIAWTWKDAVNPGREIGVDASMQQRVYAFKKLWGFWKESPVIGWGVCSWALPDSQYARTLSEIGILGLGLWIWIFTRLFKMSKWLFENSGDGMMKGFLLGYRAGLLGLAMHGFGAITLYIVRIMEPFWFVSGLVVSLYLIKIREVEEARMESLEEVKA